MKQNSSQYVAAAIFVSVAVVVLAISSLSTDDQDQAEGPQPATETQAVLDPPKPPESPFLNVTSAASYVGSDACTDCHQEEAQAYSLSRHHQSMSEVDTLQLPDATVPHPASGFSYEAAVDDAGISQKEYLAARGAKTKTQEFLVEWVMGSGRFGHSFLLEDQGYLLQSPLTWYSTRECWDMSPGYDHQNQMSFRRTVSAGCLFCHAGIVEVKDENDLNLEVIEPAIGCERCHGPGSLHVDWHEGRQPQLFAEAGAAPPSEAKGDSSIVNPARLDRNLREAVCQQCHLQGDTQVLVRGQDHHSFRPGLPLSSFRQEYRIALSDDMTIVGHVEQMQQSLCYTSSETLTCTTCHDPHVNLEGEALDIKYRNACLSCHSEQHCTTDLTLRQKAGNRCVQCHMPSAPTEVPHVAFTHHRIGIHSPTSAQQEENPQSEGAAGSPDLIALLPAVAPESDDNRCRGLALLTLYLTRPEASTPEVLSRVQQLLHSAWEGGARDAAVAAGLAQVARESGWRSEVEHWARLAVEMDASPSEARLTALADLGAIQFQRGQYIAALESYSELSTHRREVSDWFYRGLCEQNLGRTEEAVRSLRRAVECDPTDKASHTALAELYALQGNAAQEAHHRSMVDTLTQADGQPE